MNEMEELIKIFGKRKDLKRIIKIVSLREKNQTTKWQKLENFLKISQEREDWPAISEALKGLGEEWTKNNQKKVSNILKEAVNKKQWETVLQILEILSLENGEKEKIAEICRKEGRPEISLRIAEKVKEREKREKLKQNYIRMIKEEIERWLRLAEEAVKEFKNPLIEEATQLALTLPEPEKSEQLEMVFIKAFENERIEKAYLIAKQISSPLKEKLLEKVWKKFAREGKILEGVEIVTKEIQRELTLKEKEWLFKLAKKKGLNYALELTKAIGGLWQLEKLREIFNETISLIERKKMKKETFRVAIEIVKMLFQPEKNEKGKKLIIACLKGNYDREAKIAVQFLENSKDFYQEILN